jgi:energy-coupling factor transporter transmembrane protein EcfT
MFRVYAHFSVNHPFVHQFNLLIVLAIFMVSCYQLLANEAIVFSIGFVLIALPLFVFAKASDYKSKYLSTKD